MLPARLPHDRIRRTYTWIAPTHDLLAVVVESRARAAALKAAEIVDGSDVLEVAVGTGLTLSRIIAENPTGITTGVDLTPAMLRRAERRAARNPGADVRLEIADAHHLPFPDESFDTLVNGYMFDLLPVDDFATVLSEFHRVLRPGGRMVILTMATAWKWYHRLWEVPYRIYPPLLGGCRGVDVEPAIRRAGFDLISSQRISQRTFPSRYVAATRPGATFGE